VENPYTPPTSDVGIDAGANAVGALASRAQRFFAALIDGIILMILLFPVASMAGLWEAMSRGERSPLGTTVMMGVAGFAAYLLVNGYLLASSGQTVGKRLLKIKIVGMDGAQPTLAHIVTRRVLPLQLIGLIPMVGQLLGFADALFIFRGDKRCIHDLIANTQVVSA
jgi:uncharacterized RDD family membrane protein YckC